MTITFEERGYETFKEFPSEARPVQQNVLSTIEFGLSPFVPFTQNFAMYHGDIGGNGFGLHASSEPGDPGAEAWKTRIQDYTPGRVYGLGGADAVTTDVDNAPYSSIESEATRLSRRISLMLEQEGIAPEHESSVREEVEGRGMAHMLMDTMTTGQWKDPNVNEQVNVVQAGFKKLGGETFDLYGRTQADADVLEYNLHMIARQIGDDGPAFVQGVRAMETTTEYQKKFWQQIMRNDEQTGVDIATRWDDAVHVGVAMLMDKWDFAMQPFEEYYDLIGPEGGTWKGSKKGGEELEYFARQLLSRFAAIEAGQFGEAYIFQAPVGEFQVGLARIEPIIRGSHPNAYLDGVEISTEILGGDSFQELQEAIGDAAFEKFTKQTYAGNAQMLLWDYRLLFSENDAGILAIAQEVYQPVVNRIALQSDRGEILGNALRTEMEVGLGNVVQGSARVQAVEVIGSREATDIVKTQVEAFFRAPGIASSFEKFYKAAQASSEALTSTWKGRVDADNRTVDAGSIYANQGGLFTNGATLAGIGIPFWFMVGRDPTGYMKFKESETHSKAKFRAFTGEGDVVPKDKKGVEIPEHKRGVLMSTGRHAGTYQQVRDPRDYYITQRGRPGSQKQRDYMGADWRAELMGERGAEMGAGGVLREDMTSVEAVLSKSRLGGVQQNRDKAGRYLTGYSS